MLKVIVWSAALSATGAAALLVPIEPSLLKAVGLSPGTNGRVMQDATRSGSAPLNIVSSNAQPGRKVEFRVLGNSAASPYQAVPKKVPPSKYQRVRRIAIAAAPRLTTPPMPVVQPSPPTSAGVIRNMQIELRRVGCYHGRIDGDWGPASRFAMAAFTKAVNAALPTDRPDDILLTLVRRHAGTACGLGRATTVQTATATVPQARVNITSRWQVRVAPAQPPTRTRLVRRPRLQQPPAQLVKAPRIIRADGTHAGRSLTIARTRQRLRIINGERMSLGVVPAPTAARSVTADGQQTFIPHAPWPETVERPRYKPPRIRKRRVNRRRYRKKRTQAWRRAVFPGVYD